MARLEQLTRGAIVKGILPDALVTVVDVQWHGDVAITLTYRDAAGRLGNEILYRDREPSLEIATVGLPWSFDGDGTLLRLVSEAYRIHLAYLFDPLLAVHTSLVVGKTINSPILTHLIASSLSLIRTDIPLFSDAYSSSWRDLVHTTCLLAGAD